MNDVPVLVVTHRSNLVGYQRGMIEALARSCRLSLWLVEDRGWPRRRAEMGADASASVVIWYVKFRHLLEQAPFDWQGYSGARVMFDMDAYQNFSSLISNRHLGRWPDVVRRQEFDVLMCTGGVVAERFRELGIPAAWVPKAYDATRIHDENRIDRAGVCSYGTEYLARRVAVARLQAKGLAPSRFRCAPMELSRYLNRFAASLVCNMEVVGSRRVPIRVLATTPSSWLRVRPGIEPMIKNFEVAAAGCAPICDALDDLGELGFADGDTMVSYSSMDQLVERVRHYADRPDELRAIGSRAAALARARHTWDHRAAAMLDLVG